MRIALIVAHSAVTERQAHLEDLGLSEYDVSLRQAEAISLRLSDEGHRVVLIDTPQKLYPGYVQEHLRLLSESHKKHAIDLAVELHHNAGETGRSGPYSLVLYGGSDARVSRPAAEAISDQLAAVVPWRSVGAQPAHWTGHPALILEDAPCPLVLTEAGFFADEDGAVIPEAAIWYGRDGIEIEADAIASGICLWASQEVGDGSLP